MLRYGLTVEAFPRVPGGDLQGWGSPRDASRGNPLLTETTANTAQGLEPELLGPLVLTLLAQLSHYTNLAVLHQ